MNPNNLPDISGFRHHTDIQLRFSDVDVLGHVNNTVYMSFYDTGKAHFFTEILGHPVDWHHVETVIANIDCAFIAPIYFGEDVEVLTRCESISEKSFKLLQVIRTKEGMVKSACETIMVAFDAKAARSMDIPTVWREALENSMKEREPKEASGER